MSNRRSSEHCVLTVTIGIPAPLAFLEMQFYSVWHFRVDVYFCSCLLSRTIRPLGQGWVRNTCKRHRCLRRCQIDDGVIRSLISPACAFICHAKADTFHSAPHQVDETSSFVMTSTAASRVTPHHEGALRPWTFHPQSPAKLCQNSVVWRFSFWITLYANSTYSTNIGSIVKLAWGAKLIKILYSYRNTRFESMTPILVNI